MLRAKREQAIDQTIFPSAYKTRLSQLATVWHLNFADKNNYFLFRDSWEWYTEAYHNEYIGKVEPIVYDLFRAHFESYKFPELL